MGTVTPLNPDDSREAYERAEQPRSVTGNGESSDSRNDELPDLGGLTAAFQAESDRWISEGAVRMDVFGTWEHHRAGERFEKVDPCTHQTGGGCCGEDLPCGSLHGEWENALVFKTSSGAWLLADSLALDIKDFICHECRRMFGRIRRRRFVPDPAGRYYSLSKPEHGRFRKADVRRTRSDARYCSSACRQKAYRLRGVNAGAP